MIKIFKNILKKIKKDYVKLGNNLDFALAVSYHNIVNKGSGNDA